MQSIRPVLLGLLLSSSCAPAPALEPAPDSLQNGVSLNGRKFNGRKFNGRKFNGVLRGGAAVHGLSVVDSALAVLDGEGKVVASGTALEGAKLVTELEDGQSVTLRIDEVRPSAEDPKILLHRISVSEGGPWEPLCDPREDGAVSLAIPLAGVWDESEGHLPGRDGPDDRGGGAHLDTPGAITFACQGYVLAKCVEQGYKPWQVTHGAEGLRGEALHQACTRMMRADYCGDGSSHTRDGTPVDVGDVVGIQTRATAWPTEGAWSPDGATCASGLRWLDASSGPVEAYVFDHCPQIGQFALGADHDCMLGAWTGASHLELPEGTLIVTGTERPATHAHVPLIVFTVIAAEGAPGQLWFSGPVVDDLGRPLVGAQVTARLERDGAAVFEGTTTSAAMAERTSWALFDGTSIAPAIGQHHVTITRLEGTSLPWDGETPANDVTIAAAHVEGISIAPIDVLNVEATVRLGDWGRTRSGTTALVSLELVQAGRSVGATTQQTDASGVARLQLPVPAAGDVEVKVRDVSIMIDSSRARLLPFWDGQRTAATLAR